MNKINRVIVKAVAVLVATVGVLNIIDYIYAATSVDASTSGLTASATINPSSTVEVTGSAVSLDITPSTNGTFASGYTTVSTYTNTSNTCNVVMSTTSTNLTSSATDTPIQSIASDAPEGSNFPSDRWGYRVGSSGDYSPIITDNAITSYTTNTGSSAQTADIYFAAKLSQATKPGDYTNTVTFSSTCEPAGRGVASSYMQDQDASTLAALMPNVGDEVTLTDSRDGKEYTVAHLADGNFWMTQNLDHDIKTDGTVTYNSTTTDIPSAWTPSTATYTTGTTTWDYSYNVPQSYDPGDLCWNGTPEDDTTVSCSQSGSHYHLGNFYNWTAAVAMNNSSSYTDDDSGTDVDQSICPAGWTLPKDGSTTDSGSFQYLVTQYGWDDSSYMMEGDYQMWDAPLYFLLFGYWDGRLNDVGNLGYYWSSVVLGSDGAYYPYYASDGVVDPVYYYTRDGGFSVRCVAR